MRKVLLSSLLAGLLAGPAAGLRADEESRAIVERAVKALGGLDKITSIKAIHRKSKGTYHAEGSTFLSESFSQSPERLKIVQGTKGDDGPASRVLVLEGDKGWLSMEGFTQDLDEELLGRFRRARHADRVAGLVALLRDKDKKYTLSPLGDSQVKDKAVVGVKVSAQGQPDVNLYFEKATGLLLKTSQRLSEPRVDNEVLHEWYYSDYKAMDVAAPDEAVLKAAKVATDGPALLEFLRQRTPTPDTREKIKELIKQLSDPAFRVRTKATAELKKFGPEAASLLRQALQDPDREVSRRAEECLGHINRQPAAALVPAALRLLGVRRPPGAAAVLLAYLPWAQDEKVTEDVGATLAAVAFQNGKPDPVLTQAEKDANPLVRVWAKAALSKDRNAYLKQPGRQIIVEGLRYAGRAELYRDGKRQMELEVLDIQIFNRLDDSIFARPSPER